jgi:creatinine amidohydrolase
MDSNSIFEIPPLHLKKLSWPAIRDAAQHVRIVILPVGSLEQHGPHLPIDVDTMTATHLAVESTRKASKSLGRRAALIGPTIPFGGPGLGMDEWPGTIRLRPQVFIDLYHDIGSSLARAGFSYVIALNGCYGNVASLALACQLLKMDIPDTHFLVLEGIWADQEIIAQVRESEVGGTGHAGEVETSIALAIDPQHVDMTQAVDEFPTHPSSKVSFDFSGESPYFWPVRFSTMTHSGVMGKATLGTKEKGGKILEAAVERIANILIELNSIVS